MLQTKHTSPEFILQRIDAIIAELKSLSQSVMAMQVEETSPEDLVDQLAGSLGQGSWDEYDEFLDWERFAE